VSNPRFYLPATLDVATVELTGPEAHHLRNVLRLEPGSGVELFDGMGTTASARIETVSKRNVTLSILDRYTEINELPAPLILATAVPKGERFRWLIEKATELGVSQLIPLNTERSVVSPGEAKLEKMRAVVIAACKQSRRSRLMEIAEPLNLSDCVKSIEAESQLFVAHPGGSKWEADQVTGDSPCIVLIGPEGGFSETELEQLPISAIRVDLGSRILRIETAALAMVSLCGMALSR